MYFMHYAGKKKNLDQHATLLSDRRPDLVLADVLGGAEVPLEESYECDL